MKKKEEKKRDNTVALNVEELHHKGRMIKQKWRKEAKISVKTLLEVVESPKGCFTNNEKLINIKIDKGYVVSSCSFPTTKKGKREALKFIAQELYL